MWTSILCDMKEGKGREKGKERKKEGSEGEREKRKERLEETARKEKERKGREGGTSEHGFCVFMVTTRNISQSFQS